MTMGLRFQMLRRDVSNLSLLRRRGLRRTHEFRVGLETLQCLEKLLDLLGGLHIQQPAA